MNQRTSLKTPHILNSLGIYGYESIEWPILAGLVTGDPVLLIGGHGAAKTYLCGRLAKALKLSFKAYDASKNLFEDVLGFPNPEAMKKGSMDYISTPVSVWGTQFLLVDEISRAVPDMQSKWLEVIRNRSVMGKQIDGLSYIFSAMNPPSYLGAYPLDEALAGRYAVVAVVPSTEEMTLDLQSKIIHNLTGDDAPLCRDAFKTLCDEQSEDDSHFEEASLNLIHLLDRARQRLPHLSDELQNFVSDYILNLNLCLKLKESSLDGRRMGMLWRTLLAGCALWQEVHQHDDIPLPHLNVLLLNLLQSALPMAATQEEIPSSSFYLPLHSYAFNHGGKSLLNLSSDPLLAALEYRSMASDLTEDQHRMAATYFLERCQSKNLSLCLRGNFALTLLSSICISAEIKMHPDTRQQLLEKIRRVSCIKDDIRNDLRWDDILDPQDRIPSPQNLFALRLAIGTATQTDTQWGDSSIDSDHVLPLFKQALALYKEVKGLTQ